MKKTSTILALIIIVWVCIPSFSLVKIKDRPNDYVLPQSFKERIANETKGLSEEEIKNYSFQFTADLLTFAERNNIAKGEANCVGYAKLCASVYNYAVRQNHIPNAGHAKPVVGYVHWGKMDLHAFLTKIAATKYTNFVKDHDFVQFSYGNHDVYEDPTTYDVIGNKFTTHN